MATKIFVNLPVKNLQASMEFFTQLGYTFNPQFTDEKAASLVISEDIYAMLLTEPFFKTFIQGKEVTDTAKAKEVLICLSTDSREAVNRHVDKALAAGGKEFGTAQDHGFMYIRNFEDLDGHVWEIMWMDPSFVMQQETAGVVAAEG